MYRHREDALAVGLQNYQGIKGPAGFVSRSYSNSKSWNPVSATQDPCTVHLNLLHTKNILHAWLRSMKDKNTPLRHYVSLEHIYLQLLFFPFSIFPFFFFKVFDIFLWHSYEILGIQERLKKMDGPILISFFSYNISNVISIFLGECDNKQNERGFLSAGWDKESRVRTRVYF